MLVEGTPDSERIEVAIAKMAALKLPFSVKTRKQALMFRADFMENGQPVTIVATVRHDDECGNGHNTFAVTGTRYERYRNPGESTIIHKGTGKMLWCRACGRIHDDIAKHMPELAKYIRWHLMGTTCPMHYVANARYWRTPMHNLGRLLRELRERADQPIDVDRLVQEAKQEIINLKSTIIFGALPDDEQHDPATMEEADLVEWLVNRLPALMLAFKTDVMELGLTY